MSIQKIGMEQLDNFSVDEPTNRLYWKGNEVVTVVSLPWWVQVSALAGGLGTAISAAVAVAQLFMK